MTTKNGDLLRGGTPIVCIAHRSAFRQEADYLAAMAGSGGPAPRISIKIVPDPSAEQPQSPGAPEGTEPAGKQDAGKQDKERG